MNNHYLDCLGTNPSQTQENLSNTPLLDSLDYGDIDFDLSQPWMNASLTWDDQPLIHPFPPAGAQDTQLGLPTPCSDHVSSFGSDTLVETSSSDSSSPTSPAPLKPTPVMTSNPPKTYPCPWVDCTHRSNTKRDLSRHTASRHEGKEKKHTCRADPRCPRRLEGWVRKDLRDRHEKIHLRHSSQGAAKRKAVVTDAIVSQEVECIGRADAQVRRERHMRTPKEELVARIMMLEDNADSVMGFVALAHKGL